MPTEPLPAPGLGTGGLQEPEECRATIARALEVGYRHLDTAQKYDNEAVVGRAVAEHADDPSAVFVATKVAEDQLAHEDVLETAEASLERLGVDRFDLLYVHWPAPTYDPEATLSAFNELHRAGLVRNVGVANFTVELVEEARARLEPSLFAIQVEMHPLLQQRALQDYAHEHDCYLVAYCPLVRGDVGSVPELGPIAEKHGATPAQVSLAWLMGKENVVPIPKATGAHVEENFRARDLELDPEDVAAIEAIDREGRVVDPPDRGPWNW